MDSLHKDPSTPPPAPFNMAHYVLTAGLATPDKTALQELSANTQTAWTYRQITEAVTGLAGGLLAQGLTPGDRVLMRLDNTVDFPITFLACLWAGLVPVPTAAGLTAPEVAAMVAELRPALTIAAPGMTTGGGRILSDIPHAAPVPPQMGDPDRLGYIVYTSGSSGKPRAVCHAHRAIWARRLMWDGWYDLRRDDRLLHAGAFNWTYTLGTGLMDPWSMGATALIARPGTKPTELPAMLTRATLFAAAPGVYRQMLRGTMPALPDLRHGLSAGEALPQAVRDQWTAATGTRIYEALGMSECSTFISGSPARPAPQGTAGYAQTGRALAVLEDGAPVPRGTPGVLAMHRSEPGLMLGYWDGTAPAPVGEWFETGDEVMMAEDGAITYLGRRDDMMNPGGFRVSPLEVEGKLRLTKGVTDVAVTQVNPTLDKGLIAAFYVGTDAADLRAQAEATLAPYKRPHLYVPMHALPKTANGKMNRKALRMGDTWRAHLREGLPRPTKPAKPAP